jgi:shikimate kinase
MDARLIRTPAVYLVGFMGSGKTTIGSALADELGWTFCDLDDDIEATAGARIVDIFERRGEVEFRRLEHEALDQRVRAAKHGQPMVVALGGGTFAQEKNASLLKDQGITIWLDAPFELVRERVAPQSHRPLARDPEKFAALFEARLAVYEQADYRVKIDGDDPRVAVTRIMALPIFD